MINLGRVRSNLGCADCGGRCGMGDFTCDDNGCYDDGSSSSVSSGDGSSSSTASSIAAAIAAAAAASGPLVKSLTQQSPYFITSPTGQSVLFNPNTGTVSGGTALTSLSSLGSLSSLLPVILIGGFLFLVAGRK